MSDLVTGEAVPLDLRLARLASRGVALLIDVSLQLAVLLVIGAFGVNSDLDTALLAAIGVLILVTVMVGYPVTFETLSRGRSLGKMALGLRVVREDGGPVRFRQALVRGLAGFFVDFWVLGLFGTVAVVVSGISAKGKRVGDYLAGTVVVQERIPVQAVPPVAMPPQLAGWAAGLDVAALPNDLALAVRQYLGRYHQLHPGARDALGARLAEQVSGHVGAPLPADGSAPAYLAAVLAERRAREQARLWAPPPVPPAPSPPAGPGGQHGDTPFAPPG
ncbi:MAG TPA: RDD family protein [Actinophytocola sp.]|uniref:RDD family protein n=1 Tax=Actinophytocola sp. TaxID=1872138 RepID=UPI002DB66DB5|nr:RDD family protein [Actinophytocola sp.]HEU5476060.1 RDD family protein [Actinophytocola sp.]